MKHRNRKNIPQDAKILDTNMEEVEWISRKPRKRRRIPFTGRTGGWWESERISQWMCVLFMIGPFAFTLGALLCFDLSLLLAIQVLQRKARHKW